MCLICKHSNQSSSEDANLCIKDRIGALHWYSRESGNYLASSNKAPEKQPGLLLHPGFLVMHLDQGHENSNPSDHFYIFIVQVGSFAMLKLKCFVLVHSIMHVLATPPEVSQNLLCVTTQLCLQLQLNELPPFSSPDRSLSIYLVISSFLPQ